MDGGRAYKSKSMLVMEIGKVQKYIKSRRENHSRSVCPEVINLAVLALLIFFRAFYAVSHTEHSHCFLETALSEECSMSLKHSILASRTVTSLTIPLVLDIYIFPSCLLL